MLSAEYFTHSARCPNIYVKYSMQKSLLFPAYLNYRYKYNLIQSPVISGFQFQFEGI